MTITLREYRPEDFKELQNIIRETWHYDEFCSPKTANRLSEVFLSSCLTNYTFSRVAVYKGVPVGIILVNNKKIHKCPAKNKLHQMKAIFSLFMLKEGRKVSKIFESVNGIDKQLLDECKMNYPAELALFAVNSSYRGKGIGKKLFAAALEYINEQKIDNFYLFTDTSCNFGFYEHHGMKKRNEKEHIFNIKGQKAKMKFFIYDYSM